MFNIKKEKYLYLLTNENNLIIGISIILTSQYQVGINVNIDYNDFWTYDELKLTEFDDYTEFDGYYDLYIQKLNFKYNFLYPKEIFMYVEEGEK